MYRWCAKNSRLVMFLWIIPATLIFSMIFIYYELPILPVVLFYLIMCFTGWMFVSSCARQLLIKALNALNDECDPYPLLKEAENHMSYAYSQSNKQVLLIDYCCALSEIGEYKENLEKLESIIIDKYTSTLPITKAIYYNNLAAAYLNLNVLEKAELCINKAKQLYDELKNVKQKNMLSSSIQSNIANLAYHRQDYNKSIEILDNIQTKNLRDSVYIALSYAEIYIVQDKIEEAKLKLQFVIENGNKLIAVQRAKDLLAKI